MTENQKSANSYITHIEMKHFQENQKRNTLTHYNYYLCCVPQVLTSFLYGNPQFIRSWVLLGPIFASPPQHHPLASIRETGMTPLLGHLEDPKIAMEYINSKGEIDGGKVKGIGKKVNQNG